MKADGSAFWIAFWHAYHLVGDDGLLEALPLIPPRADAGPRINPGTALAFAAECFSTSSHEILGRSREANLAEARALVVWAMRKCGDGWSYPAIGRVLGGRDHSTIMSLFGRATDLHQRSERFSGCCDDILAVFNRARPQEEAHPCHQY